MTSIWSDRLCPAIDASHRDQVEFLATLVRRPSENPPGDCAAHGAMTADLIQAMGFDVVRHPVSPRVAAANGVISTTNILARRRFGAGPVIALNAHGDVVPPGEGWSVDPYGAVIRDGRMFGRGVAFSKGDIATYAFALKALEPFAADLRGTVELHITYDEESGGLTGPVWLLDRGLTRPDFVISAGSTYNVVVALNGCLHLEIRVEGQAAHAARPGSGADALEATAKLLNALYALRDGYRSICSSIDGIDHPTLVVGLIKGGTTTNVVPDVVTIRVDRRIIPEEDVMKVESELVAVIDAALAGLAGIDVNIRRILLARPLVPMPGQDTLVRALQKQARAVLGFDIPANGMPFFSDARFYAAAGIPTVLYGAAPRDPFDARGHAADERLELNDLRAATKIVALTLAELLAA